MRLQDAGINRSRISIFAVAEFGQIALFTEISSATGTFMRSRRARVADDPVAEDLPHDVQKLIWSVFLIGADRLTDLLG